jgi:DNA topoisomerase-1
LSLPREIGKHPETHEVITAGIGRFGPYLKHGSTYKSLGADDDVLTIGLNRAVSLLAEAKGGGRRGASPGKPIGDHPADSQPVTLHEGRYGPYVKHGKLNATLPKSMSPDQVTLDQAVSLLQERAAKGGGGPNGRAPKGKGPRGRGKAKAASEAAPAAEGAASKKAAPKAPPKRKSKQPEDDA